ncbi:MAG: hypothetical protein JW971_06715 [Synergistales bacterium]|nr:hypothetical protein [Synergistales bacterium]
MSIFYHFIWSITPLVSPFEEVILALPEEKSHFIPGVLYTFPSFAVLALMTFLWPVPLLGEFSIAWLV